MSDMRHSDIIADQYCHLELGGELKIWGASASIYRCISFSKGHGSVVSLTTEDFTVHPLTLTSDALLI